MKRKISLRISQPCSERLDTFQATEMGGFCNSCQKEVVDFTKMSDHEIIQYFKEHPKNTCGYFRQNQLKTYADFTSSKRKSRFHLLKASLVSFSLVSLLTIKHSQAQHKKQATTLQIPQKEEDHLDSKVKKEERTIEGVVVYEDEPLIGVSVYFKGTTVGVVTDAGGKFKLTLPLEQGNILVFQAIGFKTKEYAIPENISKTLNITMKLEEIALMGEVSVDQVYQSKRSLWQKIKGIFE